MEPGIPDSISEADERRVSRYVDGALVGEELAAFEATLAERPDLRRLIDEVISVDMSVSRALGAAVGSSDRVGVPWSAPPERGGGFSWLLSAAALVLVALGLWAAITVANRDDAFRQGTVGQGEPDEVNLRNTDDAGSRTERTELHEPVGVASAGGVLPLEDERRSIVDHAIHAAYIPAVSGPSQGEYFEESHLMSVFDREENRLYLFELKHARATIRTAWTDL